MATVERALRALAGEAAGLTAEVRVAIVAGAREAVQNEITLERSDLMRGIGRALGAIAGLAAADASRIRTAIASALVQTPPRVDTVVVVRHAAQADLLWRAERDRWGHELTDAALLEIAAAARAAGLLPGLADAATPGQVSKALLALEVAPWSRRSGRRCHLCPSTRSSPCSSSTPPAPPASPRASCMCMVAGSPESRTRCGWRSTPRPATSSTWSASSVNQR